MNDGEVKGCLKSTNTPNGIIFFLKECRIVEYVEFVDLSAL